MVIKFFIFSFSGSVMFKKFYFSAKLFTHIFINIQRILFAIRQFAGIKIFTCLIIFSAEHRVSVQDKDFELQLESALKKIDVDYYYRTDAPNISLFRLGWVAENNGDCPAVFHPLNGYRIPEQGLFFFLYILQEWEFMVKIYLTIYYGDLDFGGVGCDGQSTIKVGIYPDRQAISSYEVVEGEPFQIDIKDNVNVEGILVPRFTYFYVKF